MEFRLGDIVYNETYNFLFEVLAVSEILPALIPIPGTTIDRLSGEVMYNPTSYYAKNHCRLASEEEILLYEKSKAV
jgi:hypothetical protein